MPLTQRMHERTRHGSDGCKVDSEPAVRVPTLQAGAGQSSPTAAQGSARCAPALRHFHGGAEESSPSCSANSSPATGLQVPLIINPFPAAWASNLFLGGLSRPHPPMDEQLRGSQLMQSGCSPSPSTKWLSRAGAVGLRLWGQCPPRNTHPAGRPPSLGAACPGVPCCWCTLQGPSCLSAEVLLSQAWCKHWK